MRKAIYVGVAVLTFTLGGIVYYLTTLKPRSEAVPVSKPAEVQSERKPEEKPAEVPVAVSITLRIGTIDDDPPKYLTLKLSEKPVVVDDLDVMEKVDGEEITVLGGDKSTQFRILERYRTSMTVMGEGPHLDLVDWRHYDSEWVPLDQLAPRKFRTLTDKQMDDEKFPTVTPAELMAAVRKYAGDWPEAVDLAKGCRGAKDFPCGVGISSVYFRVEMLVGDEWTKVGVVEVMIPMGC